MKRNHRLQCLLLLLLLLLGKSPPPSLCFTCPFISSHEFVIFKKRGPAKTRKQPLFRFDNSRHALSVSSYIKEQRDKELAAQVQVSAGGCGY